MTDYEMEKADGEQIRISLVLSKSCTDRSLAVPTDPIAVPSLTRKKGLSAIINHLLDRKVVSDKEEDDDTTSYGSDDEDKLPAIPFDFLLNNKLLRMSVEAAARKEGLSLEKAVEIQYFPARNAPEGEGETEAMPDWISSMSYSSNVLITGNCDGSIRFFRDGDVLKQMDVVKAHSGPVKCISSCAYPNQSENIMVASGSMDHTLLTHSYDKGSNAALHAVYSGGHTSSICSVRLTTNNNDFTMASGEWNGGLCIWDIPSSENDEFSQAKKKKKGSNTVMEVKEVSPKVFFKAHSQNISGIEWGAHSLKTIITSSWDHSIKTWDTESQNNILTLNGSKVVTCLSRCHNSDVVATGHPDCSVRLWDMRTSGSNEGNVFDSSLRPR